MRRAAECAAAAVVTMAGVLACAGCDRTESVSVEELRLRMALRLLEGASVGFADVKAGRCDPDTLELFDVQLDDGKSLVHAERAEILISTERQTVSLRLHGVTGAGADVGRIVTLDGLTTEPARLRVRVEE